MSSVSRNLHKNRKVLPRMYSLGCCRSFLMPLLEGISVCRVEVPATALPDQDHLLFQFPTGVKFWAYFVVEVK